jgi:hypothetical protein
MKKPMSFKDHQSLGQQLNALNKSLMDASIRLQNTYGVTSQVGKLAKKASEDTAKLRSALDDQIGKDCPTQDAQSLNRCYFGE